MNEPSHTYYINDQDDENESLMIHDIARLSKKNFDRRVRDLGITRAQWLTIGTLRRHPGISQTELAERLDVEPITVARTLDRLETSGWIERRADVDDRRMNRVYLTARVQDVVASMRTHSLALRRESLVGIDAEEHRILTGILKKIKHNLCEKNKAGQC